MSSASLAVSSRVHPDPARIAALSAAIALNLAVLVMAARPFAGPMVSPDAPTQRPLPIHFIEPKPVVPPPPIELKPFTPKPVAPPATPRTVLPTAPPVVIPHNEGTLAVPDVPAPALAPPQGEPGMSTGSEPVEASLAYRAAPLQFPNQALRQRLQGSVMLRVLVDETGKPVEVIVEKSSGHTLLDRSARSQVLAGWRFQPAMVNGKAVPAWARVPVTFTLNNL